MGIDEKRRTLIFPPPLAQEAALASSPLDSAAPPDVDAGWDAVDLAAAEPLSSASVIPDEEEDERPSGRKTIPTELAPFVPRPRIRDDAEVVTAPSARVFAAAVLDEDLRVYRRERRDSENERALATTRPPPTPPEPVRPSLKELYAAVTETPAEPVTPFVAEEPEEPEPALEQTPSSLPPISLDARPPLTSAPAEMARSYPVPSFVSARTAALFAASNFAVGALVLGTMVVLRPEPKPAKRDVRIALADRVTRADEPGIATEIAPLDGCRVEDLARVIATRAELGPGLDASALESGFGIGLAATATEAVGVRLEAETLRTAETIKVRTPSPFAHVTIDRGADPDARIDVRLDAITAHKGGVFGRDGRLIWALPGPAPKGYELVRAAVRSDGGSVVAVRRPAHFWVGVQGSGPMTAILRARRQLGTPALAATEGGGAIAWAERGTAGYVVAATTISADGKRTTVGAPLILAEGISPALTALPNGELLLAYADGKAGAHRIVAQRLGPDLDPRGELLVVSSDDANAGQPAVAVDAEGRAIVAFVTVEHGHTEVHATELLCR